MLSILIDFAVGNKRIVPFGKSGAVPSETGTAFVQRIRFVCAKLTARSDLFRSNEERCKNKSNRAQEFDENVERRTCSVLERIANRIPNHRGFVSL